MAKYLAAFLMLLLAAACGSSVENLPLQNTECRSGSAQLSIRDGFIKRVCGCGEGAGTVMPPAAADCTVAAGTVVFFSFASADGVHQIVSRGTPSFPSSSVSDPQHTESPIVRSHSVRFATAGTFEYKDAFNSGLFGAIIVQ